MIEEGRSLVPINVSAVSKGALDGESSGLLRQASGSKISMPPGTDFHPLPGNGNRGDQGDGRFFFT